MGLNHQLSSLDSKVLGFGGVSLIFVIDFTGRPLINVPVSRIKLGLFEQLLPHELPVTLCIGFSVS